MGINIETYGFELSYEPEGVYFQLKKTGKYTTGDILRWISLKKIKDADLELLEKIINTFDYQRIKIAEPQEEEFVDESIKVYTEDRNMKAYVILRQGDLRGKRYTSESLVEELAQKHNIKAGLIDEAIKTIIEEKPYEEKVLVAKGQPPYNGKDGYVEYRFDTNRDKKGTTIGNRIDYKQLNLIHNVETGDILANKIPPENGIKGFEVTGRPLDAKDGKEAIFYYGKNVQETDDGNQLIATKNGRVDIVGKKIVVSPVYNINGNVDMSVGNVQFAGDIIISGSVLEGFKIEAAGSIEVSGVVENASLIAGRNIKIYKGVRGGGKTQLTAGGKVISKFIEQGTINAEEGIEAESIMHSNVYSNGPIDVTQGKGVIIGGNICSSDSISAKDI